MSHDGLVLDSAGTTAYRALEFIVHKVWTVAVLAVYALRSCDADVLPVSILQDLAAGRNRDAQ
jgi:hypothetical protein